MASPYRRARRRLIALTGIGAVFASVLSATAANAAPMADASLALDRETISMSESVTITFDAGDSVHERNWIGIYQDGVTPGGPASLDWRYVPDQSGEVIWGPAAREGWTRNAAGINAGEYDVYLLEDDGYSVLAGPIDLTVSAAETEPPTPPTEPKPEVDGVSELNVLTFNIWHGGGQIDDGMQQIADVIRETDADVTFMPERGQAPEQVAELLGYQHLSATNTGIVSRYPIVSTDTVGTRWSKAVVDVNGTDVVVYGGHLEYRWYANYLPRGYGGEIHGDWPAGWNTWNKLDAPVTDVEMILAANAQSGRPESAAELIADIAAERAEGRVAIVGGDFNEASVQDWTEATADLFDHNGVVIEWQTTATLLNGGLVDAFRAVHPDPVANPGITWPSDNALFPTSSLTWAPEADERDRIDYIFATPDDRLSIDDAAVVGPQSSIVRNERVDDDSADEIITPGAVWPSDHKAVLAKFRICDSGCETPEPVVPSLQLSVASVVAGGNITVVGSGFDAGAEVQLELRSEPVSLGAATADADGAFEYSVTIPAGTAPGAHTIAAIGADGAEFTADLAVTPAAGSGGGDAGGSPGAGELPASGSGIRPAELAATGGDSALFLWAAVVSAGIGIALVLGRRRRQIG